MSQGANQEVPPGKNRRAKERREVFPRLGRRERAGSLSQADLELDDASIIQEDLET
jgi:hypothetical protein